jgi:hypothetical protein
MLVCGFLRSLLCSGTDDNCDALLSKLMRCLKPIPQFAPATSASFFSLDIYALRNELDQHDFHLIHKTRPVGGIYMELIFRRLVGLPYTCSPDQGAQGLYKDIGCASHPRNIRSRLVQLCNRAKAHLGDDDERN